MKARLQVLCIQLFLVALAAVFGLTNLAHAQFGAVETNDRLSLTPLFPEPGQTVEAQLELFSQTDAIRSIRWFVDGIEQSPNEDIFTFTFTAGEIGQRVTLSAEVTYTNGLRRTFSETTQSSRLDIIIEADTLTPLQYAGRALPSIGSQVSAVAIVTGENPANLTYSWTLDDEPLTRGPSQNNRISFVAGKRGAALVGVSAHNRQGQIVAKKLLEVRFAQPEIHFYSVNPLRGLSALALSSPTLLVGEEITLRAEPYYMSQNIFLTDHELEWSINNQIISTDEGQQEMTFGDQGEGSATIEFTIRNLIDRQQGADGDLVLQF